MQDFIYKHFQSEGFKKRLKNWYLPALKMGLAWVYNRVVGYFETKHFKKVYESDMAIEQPLSATEIAVGTASAPKAPANDVILSYEEAVEVLRKYEIGHIPQLLGTCVAHTIKNAIRFALKVCRGRDTDLAEGDVYIDRYTTIWGIDQGMSPDKAMARVADKGIAIRDVVPTANNIAELQEITRENYPDDAIQPYRIKPLVGSDPVINAYKNFEGIWDMITNEYKDKGIRPFQVTIQSYAGWWGTDLPTATGTVNGSHSVVGIVLPFIYNGERAFFVLDSAYYLGKVWRVGKGIRIVTESCWRGLGISARTIKFVPAIEEAMCVHAPVHSVDAPAYRGNSGKDVEDIQRFLMSKGFDIPAISSGVSGYGYYGQQTATAVKAWHITNWQAFNRLNSYWTVETLTALQGNAFGNLSVQVAQQQ